MDLMVTTVGSIGAGWGRFMCGISFGGSQSGEGSERESCLLVLNLVSSTLSCIRQPRPRLRVLDVCGFV